MAPERSEKRKLSAQQLECVAADIIAFLKSAENLQQARICVVGELAVWKYTQGMGTIRPLKKFSEGEIKR